MAKNPNSITLHLPGLELECVLGDLTDTRMLFQLDRALDDALTYGSEEAAAEQSLDWRLGHTRAALRIAADCPPESVTRARRHLALLTDQPAGSNGAAQSPAPAAANPPIDKSAASHGTAGMATASSELVVEYAEDTRAQESAARDEPRPGADIWDETEAFDSLPKAVEVLLEAVAGAKPSPAGQRRREAIARLYGLDGTGAVSQVALAERLGVSPERVRQVLGAAWKQVQGRTRLRRRLEATARARAEIFWNWLSEAHPHAIDESELPTLANALESALASPGRTDLARWYACLLFSRTEKRFNAKQRKAALAEWIREHSARVGNWRLLPGIDAESVRAASDALEEFIGQWRLPQQLRVLADLMGTSEDVLAAALVLQGKRLGLEVDGDMVVGRRSQVLARRSVRLQALMQAEFAGREALFPDIAENYRSCFPDDQVEVRNYLIAMTEERGAPHLFLPAGVTGWRALGPKPADSESRLATMRREAVRAADAEQPAESQDVLPKTYREVIELLEQQGPLNTHQIAQHFADAGKSPTLPSFAIHQSGRVVRLAPRVYGLPEHIDQVRAGKRLPRALCEPDMLELAAYAVRTGEEHALFTCWSERLQAALKEAAEQAETAMTLPWRHIVDTEQPVDRLYGELHAPPKLAADKSDVERVLSAALHLQQYGRLSAAALNLVGRTRAAVLSMEGVHALTAMAALGVIDGSRPWSEAQAPGPLAEAAIEQLTTARFRAGKFDWKQPQAKFFLARARKRADRADAVWMRRGTANKVLDWIETSE